MTTDLELVRARLAHAARSRARPDVVIATLTPAIDLISGIPARYSWLDAETGSMLTTVPIAAAKLLAEVHLGRGNLNAVLEVTAKGLSILPAYTELVALRMRAHAAAGDRAAVKAEYETCRRAEAADTFSGGEPDPELEELCRALLSRPDSAA